MSWRRWITLVLWLVPTMVLAQSPNRSWYAGLEAQFTAPILPAQSIGAFIQYTLLHSSRFALSLDASGAVSVNKGAGGVCTESGNCDTRDIDRFVLGTVRGTFTMLSGDAGPELGMFVGGGAYASHLGADGSEIAGGGPSGNVLEVGWVGASDRASPVLFEVGARRFANVGGISGATAIAVKIGVRW